MKFHQVKSIDSKSLKNMYSMPDHSLPARSMFPNENMVSDLK